MAKVIKYKFLSYEIDHGTEWTPNIEQIFFDKVIAWSEENERTAAAEAYNGEYTIEDDGTEETTERTQEERIADLEEALEMLLSGVTA